MDINKLVIAFKATEKQVQILKEFCSNKMDNQYIISVQQTVSEDLELCISIFQNKPYIYVGLFSKQYRRIEKDLTINDELLVEALEMLELRYHHALSKRPPTINKELAYIWLGYFNENPNPEAIDI